MKKFYQIEWQGIQFSDFTQSSSTNLAGPEFYQAFYEEFFKRYQNWEQLSPSWRKEKERCAEFVLVRSGGGKMLSVGCGLGYMEHYMRARAPQQDLFIHEVASAAWRWIEDEFAENRKLLGMIPDCLPVGVQFDLIYLSAVDYTLDNDALVGLLSAIRQILCNAMAGRRCLLISASFQDTPATLTGMIMSILRRTKPLATAVLDHLGQSARGQFWGWTRTQKEYHSLMRRAGYQGIEDGFIDPEKRAHYWISGR